MEAEIHALFRRHEDNFNRGLHGEAAPEDAGALFTPEFIAAGPQGVATGRNDASLVEAMRAGYDHYRATGAQAMTLRNVAVTPIDDRHATAKVSWRARYRRKDGSQTDIDFEVTYFVRLTDEGPRIFGWVSGDEEALLRERGLA